MAKRRTKTKTQSRALVVRATAPKPIVIRQTAAVTRRAPRRRSHGGGGAGFGSLLSNERTGAMIGAGVLGMLDKQGTKFPTLPVVGRAGTAGLVLWWLSKSQRSAQLAHAATGCLAIAVYELSKDGKVSGAEGVDGFNTV